MNALSAVVFATCSSDLSIQFSSAHTFICFIYIFVSSDISFTDSISLLIISAIITELCTTSGRSTSSIFLAVSLLIPVSSCISCRVLSGDSIFADITFALSMSFVLLHLILFSYYFKYFS